MKKILNFFGSVKSYFADTGILAGIIYGIFMVFCFVVLFPFILIEYFNECSKRWFGGSPDA